MRITAVISSLGSGGAERVMTGLAGAWVEAGHEVTLITIHGTERDFYPLDPRIVRVALARASASRSRLHGLWANLGRLVALRNAVRDSRPEIVISFVDRANVLTLLATRGLRCPVVVSERTDPTRHPIRAGWGPLRRLTYPGAAAVVVQTSGAARWAARYNSRIVIIPNPLILDLSAEAQGDPPEWRRPAVIAVGRLGPEKGYDLLLRAFAAATSGRPEWQLCILGGGPERESLGSLSTTLGIAGRVRFEGKVPDPALYLRASEIFAHASLYEGFPNALLEAQAAGLAAVSTDCESGPSDLIEEGVNGLLVPVGDVKGYTEALGRLMDDPALRIRLGAAARAGAARFPLPAIAQRWTALFETLLPRRG
jgi:GalNAc-alpha-(1->4)-GalNAc-alpha-(1->3)-diNAcBac-PP-undecaprenol alpha-1,4-N-acetyl-D-galactosaminyltransferase